MKIIAPLLSAIVIIATVRAAELAKPDDIYFAKFHPRTPPATSGLFLKKGDRLAICGDSITEQKLYSRIMETYLTVCVPELDVRVRQYGWGGETASGFLARMTNDCLRFQPTIATTCYGMNDHRYRAYEDAIGKLYREKSTAIVDSFRATGARVVQGSPGCVSHKAEALNLNLCELRNIGVEIVEKENASAPAGSSRRSDAKGASTLLFGNPGGNPSSLPPVRFADVFWPMFTAEFAAHKKYATNYWIAGGDGVHPGKAGHAVMAYAFLKALGLNGDIGRFTVDLSSGRAQVSSGHELVSSKRGEVQIKSSRYPFCAADSISSDNSIRSAMTLIPFNQDLNRLILVARNGKAARYRLTWGKETKSYTSAQLAKGINLADEFAENPFSDAFNKVDEAVAAKQSYETKQIKQIFHELVNSKPKTAQELEAIKDPEIKRLQGLRGTGGKFDPDQIAAETEKTRAPLVKDVQNAFVPVTHTIKIEAE